MLNHNYIGTEHILLGLIHEGEGVAAKALESLGISLQVVRDQVENIIGVGQAAPSGHIPFTPRAKKVLELSLREAMKLGDDYIGTEHILLGLIREGEGLAAQVLAKLGADLSTVRQRVIQLLSGESEYEATPRPAEGDVDERLAQLRREKAAALTEEDFETASRLRDEEHRLMRHSATEHSDKVEHLRAEVEQLRSDHDALAREMERLREVLRRRGLDADEAR